MFLTSESLKRLCRCFLCLGLMLVLISPVHASQNIESTDYYITPAGGLNRTVGNLAMLHSAHGARVLQGTSAQISGLVRVFPDSILITVAVDLRYLTAEKNNLAAFFDHWSFQALTHPEAVFRLKMAEGLPGGEGDSIRVLETTATGVLDFHGRQLPVALPLALTYQEPQNTDTGEIALTAAFALRPTAFGISVHPSRADLLSEIRFSLYLFAYPVPHGTPTRNYRVLSGDARSIARKYRYPVIDRAHLFLAALTSQNPSVRTHLTACGIAPDSLQHQIETHLEDASPDSSVRRPRVAELFGRIYYGDAHVKAYELGATQVDLDHFLLAFLDHSDHWIVRYLADRSLDATRLFERLGETPKPAREVVLLGNPFFPEHQDSVDMRYARNVWDMQLWEGKIYLGHGNSSNAPPARNAGPIPIVCYDTRSHRFETEFVVDEEQIDRYRVIGNQLYVPGHDPLDPWKLGNFYRLLEAGWEKVRTIPFGIHAYDILGHGGQLYVAEGTTRGAEVSWSSDGGQTWASFNFSYTGRAWELFSFGGDLFVSTYGDQIYRQHAGGFELIRVDLFPDARHGSTPLVVRSIPVNNRLLYIGADNVNDHQWTPFAAYSAGRIDQARRLRIPESDLPYDILERDGTAYLLANRFERSKEAVTAIIYHSRDLLRWTEVVRFTVPSPARSFEYSNGIFYVGLGTHTAPLNAASGNIYRVVP